MRSDDELLSHIRQQAGVRRQRRQRALAGAAVAVVVLLLGVGALAATGDDGSERVKAHHGPSTTTTEAPTTSEAAPTTTEATTTSNSTPSTTTTTTTATTPDATTEAPVTTTEPPLPTTTAPPGIEPISQTSVGDGITLTVTATRDRAAPGIVELAIRVQSPHGSGPAGFVDWDLAGYGQPDDDDYDDFGDRGDDLGCTTEEGEQAAPDPAAGPLDASFTKAYDYGGRTATVTLRVRAHTSACTPDEAQTSVDLVVPLAG